MSGTEAPRITGFSSPAQQNESADPAAFPDEATTEQLRLMDPSDYQRIDSVSGNQDILQAAINHFMGYVELEPGDPGYVITAEGTVENHYVRKYDPEIWGAAADVFEMRLIERRLAELNALTMYQGAVLLYGEDTVREAMNGH